MFLQPDWWEVTEAGVGTNRYSYAFGDPINAKDPTGHWANPSSEACGNCKKTPKGGYSSEVNPERKKVQPGNKYCGAGCAGRVSYEKRPGDAAEYGPHAQSRMGLAAAGINDVGLDPNADMKAVAGLAALASGVGDLAVLGRAGVAAVRGLWAGRSAAVAGEVAALAEADQLAAGYAADTWAAGELMAGQRVVGGLPGQSAYYTTEETLAAANSGASNLWSRLQVRPHPSLPPRPEVGIYEVTRTTKVASGSAVANPSYGVGGGTQHFIPEFRDALRLIERLTLGK